MSLRNRVTVKEKVVYCIYHTDETTAAYRYLFGENFDKSNIIKILINNQEIDITKLVDANGVPGGWRWQFPGAGDYVVKFYLKDDITTLDYMFYDVDKLITCDFYNFNINNITSMIGVFQLCGNVSKINFRNFNARKVVNISNIFNACVKLTDVSFGRNFRTPSLLEAANMFNNCSLIEKIDMRYFDLSKCTFYNKIWANCPQLYKLYLNTAITDIGSDLSTNMFVNSIREGATLYYDYSKFGASLLNDYLPTNWTTYDYRSFE